jgi:hypothetical protein
MFKKIKSFITVSFLSLLFICLKANGSSSEGIVKASVDTNQIRIGEQFQLELNAIAHPNTEVFFPVLPDTFNHFEIVNRGKIDTIPASNPLTLRQQFTVTSFDSGFFVLPPFPFLVRNLKNSVADTLSTEALLMGVRTISVDTTKEIKDIKPLMNVPYPWKEKLPYLIGGLLLIAGLIYLAIRYTNRKKVVILAPPKPKTPAHIRTIQTLKTIEEQKLWQNGFTKKYHIEVSDTIRGYIEERFDIRAMEQTSDETLKLFGPKQISGIEKEKLQYILQLADMVKFAKVEPIALENEQTIAYAYDFVNSTIPVTQPSGATDPVKNEEVQS